MQTRRGFIKLSVLAGSATLMVPGMLSCHKQKSHIPSWLKEDAEKYILNPRETALDWFRNARFGLNIHYGLYSLLGRHEWVQFIEKIPVKEYEKLKKQFTAKDFDADFISDLVLEAGMKYLNLVVKHHDSFCLWDTGFSNFKSTNSPAKRDLLAEVSEQCSKKGIALFLNYSYGRDWRHPHAPNSDYYKSFSTRPAYDVPEKNYKYGIEHDLNLYVGFAYNQIKELLNNYGDIAGIWIGGTSTLLSGPVKPFRLPQLYKMIHKQQAHSLISNGDGVTGTEDYLYSIRKAYKSKDTSKLIEICDTLQPMDWGYGKEDDGKHKTTEQVIELLKTAGKSASNLLLNTGPLPSGKIHPEDVKTLKGVGKIIRKKGFPK